MVATAQVSCLAGVYTALSSGQTNVSFKPSKIYGGKMVIATSLPAPNDTTFKTVNGGDKVEIGSLGASDKVYWMPGSVDETIEVIRG
jgi:hypothetical protein